MSILTSVKTGPQTTACKACIYGPAGVGKTTFASTFPNPLFLDFENGSHQLDVARINPQKWGEVEDVVRALQIEQHDYRTLVIDSVDWSEKLLADDICRSSSKSSIEDFGYGKGWMILAERFAQFLESLNKLRDQGIHILFIGHSQIRKFELPDQSGSYDRYELKLSKHSMPLLKEWCDMLLFCSFDVKVVEVDGKKKAIGGKERLIYTTHTAAWDAKNRYGLTDKLSLKFSSISSIFSAKQSETKGDLIKQIESLWTERNYEPEKRTKLFEWLKIDSIPGEERWEDLSNEQLKKAIEFVKTKV